MTKQEIIDVVLSVFPEERRFIEYVGNLNNIEIPEARLFLLTECSTFDRMVEILNFMREVNYPLYRFFNVRFGDGTVLKTKNLKSLTSTETEEVTDITAYWNFN